MHAKKKHGKKESKFEIKLKVKETFNPLMSGGNKRSYILK